MRYDEQNIKNCCCSSLEQRRSRHIYKIALYLNACAPPPGQSLAAAEPRDTLPARLPPAEPSSGSTIAHNEPTTIPIEPTTIPIEPIPVHPEPATAPISPTPTHFEPIEPIEPTTEQCTAPSLIAAPETDHAPPPADAEAAPPEHFPAPEQQTRSFDEEGLYGRGLLEYRKWWEFRDILVSVSGALLSGIPAFIEKNTLRIINDEYSYFIPLEKVDYIRTNDGLESSFRRGSIF